MPRHNSAFCEECFFVYFHGQVKQAINGWKLFQHDDSILVAVSGGKDSMVLWDILLEWGYNTTGLYVDLGIGEGYSKRSREKVEEFARNRSAPVIIFDVSAKTGSTLPMISANSHRNSCSACGVIKRHIFNSTALDKGFTAVATGHNLDDEAARLLGNVLGWQMEYLSHQSPKLEDKPPSLIKKVKPLFRLTEREVAACAFLKRIDYIMEECPYSTNARSIRLKQTLNQMESESPGTKHNFYLGFLKNRGVFATPDGPDLNNCRVCGKPILSDVCAYCRLLKKIPPSMHG